MASILKVDKLDPQSGTALEIGTSGDTITVPSGATLDISSATLTPPATLPASSGVNLTALNASALGSGTVPTARLGSGTASGTTFLAGDQTYKAAGGGKVLQVVGNTNTSYVRNSTATYASTGLTQAITPSSTDSDIIILISSRHGVFNNNPGGGVCQGETALYRDIGGGGFSAIEDYLLNMGSGGGTVTASYGGLAVSTKDSPSTTSAVTYTLYQSVYTTSTSAIDINPYNNKSSIVLMEIDGS